MCTRDALFPSFKPPLGGKVGPKVGKVGPKVAPREPKGPKRSPKASPGTPKNHKKNDPGPQLEERTAREAPGVPSRGKMTPKVMKKQLIWTSKICKKGQHSALFFNGFGCENRRHSTKNTCAARRFAKNTIF